MKAFHVLARHFSLSVKVSDKPVSVIFAVVAGGCATLFHDGLMVPADGK